MYIYSLIILAHKTRDHSAQYHRSMHYCAGDCMYIYTYMCMYIYAYVCMHIHIHVPTG